MIPDLLPGEMIDRTAESYISRITVRNQAIYILAIIMVAASLLALPFLFVDVSIQANGILEPLIEKQPVLAPVSGRVSTASLYDNKRVKAGEILLTIDPSAVNSLDKYNQSRMQQLKDELSDLYLLLDSGKAGNLKTAYYKAACARYLVQLNNADNALQKAIQDYRRNQTLLAAKVIAPAAFEDYSLARQQAQNNHTLIVDQQQTQWQSEKNQRLTALKELESKQIQIDRDKKNYMIRAPVNGNISLLQGIQPGSFVTANQQIAAISPDTTLMATLFISPADIGLVKKGQQVRLQIDAFNYNQWGMADGIVTGVAGDIDWTDNREDPFFKVKCAVCRKYLQLKNGYKGYLKKGMTLHARLLITRRSLYQLLYDKLDNWLNPALSP